MTSRLDKIVEEEALLYLRNRSKLFLEAAVGSLLQSYSIAEVAKMLRDHAEHLEQFG